jgi:hypothetical protein
MKDYENISIQDYQEEEIVLNNYRQTYIHYYFVAFILQ